MNNGDRPLQIDVSAHDDNVVCRLSGSATMDACDLLNQRLMEVAQHQPPILVLDLADLDFICSLGLGGIVAAYLRARRYDGKVFLARPHPAIAEVLELTQLVTLLPVFESAEAALAAS